MVKRILCFGDSNTYGYIPGGNGRRYGPDVRWTGLLSAWLKPECLIIEEGLPGRTTVFEDPILPGRKGSDYFYPCLWSHAPLDMLLLMLGTNDCKMRFGASAKNIASGMETLVRMAISTPVWAATPKVLLISPPPMTPKCFDETSGEESGSICSEKSCQLAPLYEKAAERLGCAFLDAGVKVQVSGIDGTHMDEIAHFTMATAVMSRIRQLFQPEKGKTMKISCIDIGGTYIKSGVLEDGVLTGVEETPTDGGGGARAMLSRVAQLVRQTPGVERVGVSTAGEVDARTGVIRLSDNIPGYTGLNPRQILEGELGLPVAVENDVNAAAAGEFAFGAARDEQDFLMVSYGTGVGGAVYIGGRLYRGRAGSAGEFGGLVTHPEAVDPARQGTGSYERYASTSALVARVTALYPALTTGRDIFAHLNDPTIKKEVDAWIREVACGIISLIHAFDPALVVLGGGIMGEPYILSQLERMAAPMVKPSFRGCRVVPAALGNNAGLMGAGYLAANIGSGWHPPRSGRTV